MKKYSLFIIGLFFLLVGCLEDETTFGDQEIWTVDTVYLTDLNTGNKQKVNQGAMASFYSDPGKEFQIAAHGVYEGNEKVHFRWCLLDGTEVSDRDTLRYTFTAEQLQESNNIVMLYAYRGDKEAANVYQVGFSLNNPFGTGLVVLAKEGGNTVLDFCPRRREAKRMEFFDGKEYNISFYSYPIQENVFAANNDGEALRMTSPLNISYAQGAYAYPLPDPLKAIHLLDANWKNSIAIDLNGMKKMVYLEDEFLEMPDEEVVARDFKTIGAMSLLHLENGEIYTRVNYDRGNPCTGKFLPIPLTCKDQNNPAKAAETILATRSAQQVGGTNWCVVFEKDKKRFLVVTASDGSSGTWSAPIDYCGVFDFNNPSKAYPEGAVPMNNFDKDIRFFFVDPGYEAKLHVIYKDNDGYYLQTCNLNLNTYSSVHTFSFTVEAAPIKLSAATQQLLEQERCVLTENPSGLSSPAIFLSVGNEIYSLDLFNGDVDVFIEIEEAKGNDIVQVRRLVPWMTVSGNGAANAYFGGRFLAVAFSNGDLKIIRNYDDPRDPNNTHYEVITEKHYDGGIVDMLYY